MTETDNISIDKKRQKKWQETNIYKVKEDPSKEKFYILDMFPYPSGASLHIGHPKGFTASDTLARKKMLEGFNVLHPMGFDTFGLGTETYAIKNKMKPAIVAEQNINIFINQLESLGYTYDRSRSVNTADPKYFKWTQRIFLQMYNHYFDEKLNKAMPIASLKSKIESGKLKVNGSIEEYLNSQRLAYVDFKPINRCPSCMTGLANEDLDDGKCERCGSEVEQKPMKQRVLRITKYAQRLIDGLDKLNREESMKDLERNWIGKSEGTEFKMSILIPSPSPSEKGDLSSISEGEVNKGGGKNLSFSVYTTRIDTVFGMSFVVMSPEHNLVDQITTDEFKKDIEKYKEKAKHKTQLERTELQKNKSGQFTGAYAVNPFNNEKVPIYISDYVLANYGTGVVMAVPAHDERDFEFAKKYNITINESIQPIIKYDDITKEDDNTYETFRIILRDSQTDKYLINYENEGAGGELPLLHISNGEFFGPINDRLNKIGFKKFSYKKTLGNAVHLQLKSHYLLFGVAYDIHDNNKTGWQDEKGIFEWIDKTEFEEKLESESSRIFWDRYTKGESAFTEKGILTQSGEFSGLTSEEAIFAMQSWLEKNNIGGKKINYKMQDRVFSRQRYRGEPFPILRTEDGKVIPLDESELPLILPDVENYEPTGTEEGPLAAIEDRVNVTLPDGTKVKRETNTMPGRAGSSRYRLRYMDPNNENVLVGKEQDAYRKNVDVYIGGAEHVTRHMIYARFWQKFLFDLGIVSQEEPFQKYHSVGLIMGEDGRKMSKRRGNVVNPDDIIKDFGADVLRTYLMFMGPFDQSIARNTSSISGVKKFLNKIISLKNKIDNHLKSSDQSSVILLNQTIKKLTEDIDAFRFNTAISQLMIFVNHLTNQEKISKEIFEKLVILISPFAPHTAEELREQLGNEYSIFTKAKRPSYDEKYLVSDEVTLAVQINGKMRGTIIINKDADQNQALELVKSDSKLSSYIIGEPKKIIYVQGKILNIII